MDKLTRYGFLRTNVCLSSDVDALEAENARLLQDRLDYSNVKTTDGMNSSEWIWRTGKAERERDALEARVKNLKDDLKSTIESSNEMSDRNGELTAELAGLKEGAFQAHEQHDADQAEIARLTAELREGGREMNYTQMAEGFIQIPEEKWDAVQAELAQVKADLAVMCERQNSLKMAEVLGRYLDKKEEGK